MIITKLVGDKMGKEEEKVINGLYSCYYGLCESCSYNDKDDCGRNLIYDAYTLLKNQSPHIISLKEVLALPLFETVWLETYFDSHTTIEPFLIDFLEDGTEVLANARCELTRSSEEELNEQILDTFHPSYNVKKYRFWYNQPTAEQMKEMAWDE